MFLCYNVDTDMTLSCAGQQARMQGSTMQGGMESLRLHFRGAHLQLHFHVLPKHIKERFINRVYMPAPPCHLLPANVHAKTGLDTSRFLCLWLGIRLQHQRLPFLHACRAEFSTSLSDGTGASTAPASKSSWQHACMHAWRA